MKAALLVLVVLTAAGCAGAGTQRAADEPPDERVIPAPTSSLFTPVPFQVPRDARGFWTALEDLATRLPATLPKGEAEERKRLQACDHLAQLADAALLGDRDDYQLGPTSNLLLRGAAESCPRPESADNAYDRVQEVLEKNPFK